MRHVAGTLLEESGDHPAAEFILGHCPGASDMASIYRERMSDERLIKAVRYVRRWLGLKKVNLTVLEPPVAPLDTTS